MFAIPSAPFGRIIIWAASSEFGIYRLYEQRRFRRQKARSLAPLNGWACAVKICHDGMLEDTNLLDGAHMLKVTIQQFFRLSRFLGFLQ